MKFKLLVESDINQNRSKFLNFLKEQGFKREGNQYRYRFSNLPKDIYIEVPVAPSIDNYRLRIRGTNQVDWFDTFEDFKQAVQEVMTDSPENILKYADDQDTYDLTHDYLLLYTDDLTLPTGLWKYIDIDLKPTSDESQAKVYADRYEVKSDIRSIIDNLIDEDDSKDEIELKKHFKIIHESKELSEGDAVEFKIIEEFNSPDIDAEPELLRALKQAQLKNPHSWNLTDRDKKVLSRFANWSKIGTSAYDAMVMEDWSTLASMLVSEFDDPRDLALLFRIFEQLGKVSLMDYIDMERYFDMFYGSERNWAIDEFKRRGVYIPDSLKSSEDINESKEEKICCICKEPYEGYGNNAEPVCSGTCCDKCNIERVIPMRFKMMNEGYNDYQMSREDFTVYYLGEDETLWSKLMDLDDEDEFDNYRVGWFKKPGYYHVTGGGDAYIENAWVNTIQEFNELCFGYEGFNEYEEYDNFEESLNEKAGDVERLYKKYPLLRPSTFNSSSEAKKMIIDFLRTGNNFFDANNEVADMLGDYTFIVGDDTSIDKNSNTIYLCASDTIDRLANDIVELLQGAPTPAPTPSETVVDKTTNFQKLARKFPQLGEDVNEAVEDGTYKITYYLATATRERRPETKRDIDNDYRVDTIQAADDFEAMKEAFRIQRELDESDIDFEMEDYDINSIDDFIRYFDDTDWGDGSILMLKVEGPNGVLYDTGYTKQTFLDEFEDNLAREDEFLANMEKEDPEMAKRFRDLLNIDDTVEVDDPEYTTTENESFDDDYNFDDMDKMLNENADIKRLRHMYGVED